MKKSFLLCKFLFVLLIIAVAFIVAPDLNANSKTKLIKVKVSANPDNFSGFCPKKIIFTGKIGVKKKMKIAFRWIRSDGIKSPINKIYFRRADIKSVFSSWSLGAAGKSYNNYWQAIEIIEPYHYVSERAYFNLKCAEKVSMPNYKISGLIHGGTVGRGHLGGRKVIVRIRSGSFSRSQTLILNSDGEAPYTFSAMLTRGTYTITVRRGPSDRANYESTANICFRETEPESRRITLTASDPHADNQDFKIDFVIGWYPECDW